MINAISAADIAFIMSDNTDLGFDNSWYHAQPHPIIVIVYLSTRLHRVGKRAERFYYTGPLITYHTKLLRTNHAETKGSIHIQWDANKWPGILQSSSLRHGGKKSAVPMKATTTTNSIHLSLPGSERYTCHKGVCVWGGEGGVGGGGEGYTDVPTVYYPCASNPLQPKTNFSKACKILNS